MHSLFEDHENISEHRFQLTLNTAALYYRLHNISRGNPREYAIERFVLRWAPQYDCSVHVHSLIGTSGTMDLEATAAALPLQCYTRGMILESSKKKDIEEPLLVQYRPALRCETLGIRPF